MTTLCISLVSILFMFIYVCNVCNVLCVLHVCGSLNVESTLDVDAFKLLDFYANEFHAIRFDNLIVNEFENFILSKEMLQVVHVVDEKQQVKEEAF